MKKVLCLFVLICCMLSSCSSDDSSEELTFRKGELAQTVWEVTQNYYNDDDVIYATETFKFEFGDEPSVWCLRNHDVEYLNYKIEGNMFYLDYKLLGQMPDRWHLVEKSANRIVLVSYLTTKTVMILTRIL